MGQLIKLADYISRYQRDAFHYPGQYMRLKQENWKSLVLKWEVQIKEKSAEVEQEEEPGKLLFEKWRQFFQKREEFEDVVEQVALPKSKEALKHFFLDTLFPFQLKWASTTISEMSFLDPDYHEDLTLKYFLQRFPDTYLFMYRPVFHLKNTVVDGDILMITPVGIEIIQLVERRSEQRIFTGDDRTWYTEENNVRMSMISPMLSLKRTEKIVKSILAANQLEMPINKVVLSRTNKIEFYLNPYRTTIIGKDQHEEWLKQKRNFVSPLKYNQLKVAAALLSFSDTVSVSRPEWAQKDE